MTDETSATTVEDEIIARRKAKHVAANVRAELARRGIGPVEVADALRLHRRTAGRRLLGESPFTAYELADLAELLGCSPTLFLEGVAVFPGSVGAADPRPLVDPA